MEGPKAKNESINFLSLSSTSIRSRRSRGYFYVGPIENSSKQRFRKHKGRYFCPKKRKNKSTINSSNGSSFQSSSKEEGSFTNHNDHVLESDSIIPEVVGYYISTVANQSSIIDTNQGEKISSHDSGKKSTIISDEDVAK
ncbi:unnamed protein product [Lepeophtheirus salmonis]|uniref:(salmon louse) hypothetical protein n=1 Tax=Lepeophtheirus salmonis TaxID=72036 RepID=A0A7R8CT44_LEPSM|nr:unnamed protein product [Lepeophtheirus salmonis]CAF2922668.1 unnamed protein product [Lepeophtheirus salmonis]